MTAGRSLRPNFPLLVTVLSWGFNFVALKLLYHPGPMSPPSVALIRFLGMYGLLLALCGLRGESLKYPKGDTFRILLLGFIAMGVYMFFFLEGMRESSAAEGAIILATSPIFTALFAAAAKQERLNGGALAGACVAFVGVVIVILAGAAGERGKLLGNMLILISSVVWAFSTIVSRPLVEKHSPFRILTLSMPGALIVLIPYGLSASLSLDWSRFTPLTWAMLLHVSLLAGVVGFAGFYAGVRQIGAPGAMLYQYFVPPTAAVFAWLVLGQAMAPLQLVGLVVVILGVGLASHFRFKATQVAR